MKTERSELAALAQADTIGTAEVNREEWWHRIDLRDRQRAVGVAGLQKERASMPLATFADDERAHIRAALGVHVMQMELIAKCFNPSNTNVFGYLH